MANNYQDIIALTTGKNTMGLSNTIKRDFGIPLDFSSVQESYEAAVKYAATSTKAYVGQPISVGGTLYIIDSVASDTKYIAEDSTEYDNFLKEVGSSTEGDEASIKLENGVLSLAGFKAAADATLPQKQADGTIKWVAIDKIVKGDGNTKTIVEAANGSAIKVTSAYVEDSDTYTYTIDATIPVYGISKETGEGVTTYRLTKDGTNVVGTDIIVPDAYDDSLLSGRVETLEAIKRITDVKYDAETKKLCLFAGTEQIGEGIDATPFIKDGMLNDVEYDTATNTLTFTWNTEAGTKTDTVVLSDIIEPYSAGNGLELINNEFAIKVADDNEAFLTVNEEGIKLSGIQAAINTAAGTAKTEAIADAEAKIATAKQAAIDIAAGDATSKAAQALADAKADAANIYATKAFVGTIPADEKYADISTIVDYIEKKAEETLTAANGGSSTTIAAVVESLNNFKNEVNPKVANNTTAITTINEKLATIAPNADVNIIEAIKVNGTEIVPEDKIISLTIPTSFKDLTDDSGFDGRITAAQTAATNAANAASSAQTTANEAKTAAEEAKTAANGNTTLIEAIDATVKEHTTAVNDYATRITNLEAFQTEHVGLYNTLKDTVDSQATTLVAKADKAALEAAIIDITNNTNAITVINETTIPGINTEIAKKANIADIYTKDEVIAITGTPNEGKTLVQMIADAKAAASYDDTKVKEDISANANAIAILNSDDKTEGSIDYKIAAEVAKIINDNDASDIDTLEEIAAWIKNDTAGVGALQKAVSDNTAAIETINTTTVPNAITKATSDANKYTDEAITVLANVYETKENVTALQAALNDYKTEANGKFTSINTAIETLNGDVNTEGSVLALIAANAPDIATTTVAGLVKSVASTVENGVAVAEDGTMSVNSVNVNKLVQTEGESLVLNGGTATA